MASLAALDDITLVSLAKRGHDAAFEGLLERHATRLHAVAARLVGHDEAADILQEATISAYRGLRGFRADASFCTWMHRIVLNACYAHLRRRPQAREDLELPDDAADARPGPLGAAERGQLREALERALTQLSPEARETFVLIEYGDLDYGSAAVVLGVQPGTVKSRMSRARAALRDILERQGFQP